MEMGMAMGTATSINEQRRYTLTLKGTIMTKYLKMETKKQQKKKI